MPFRAGNNSCSLFCEQFVKTVYSIEDKSSRLWIVTEEESEYLTV